MSRLIKPAVLGLLLLTAACSSGSRPQTAASPPPSVAPVAKANGPQAFAACMRANGVPKFPNPNPSGALRIPTELGVDPTSPEYQDAYQVCQELA